MARTGLKNKKSPEGTETFSVGYCVN